MLPDSQSVRFYTGNVRRWGYSYRSLGFGRRSSQELRFAALAALGSFHGASLLDVGCGFGDLLPWLHARGIRPRYTGLDLCPPMIEHCLERFAGSGARFHVGDVLDHEPEEPYDYVVASGIFGFAARGMRQRIQPTLKHLFAMAGTGLAVNFLSRCATALSPRRLYLVPSDVLQFALTLTPAVRMDHTYMPNDFTLCMYRDPPWERKA